jgi:hypothetical protein
LPKKDKHDSPAGGPRSTADANAGVICFIFGVLIAFFEGLVILSTQDHQGRMSWVMRTGRFADLALGLGLGLGLMALVIGGFAKLIDMGATKHKDDAEQKLNEKQRDGRTWRWSARRRERRKCSSVVWKDVDTRYLEAKGLHGHFINCAAEPYQHLFMLTSSWYRTTCCSSISSLICIAMAAECLDSLVDRSNGVMTRVLERVLRFG